MVLAISIEYDSRKVCFEYIFSYIQSYMRNLQNTTLLYGGSLDVNFSSFLSEATAFFRENNRGRRTKQTSNSLLLWLETGILWLTISKIDTLVRGGIGNMNFLGSMPY